MGKHFKVEIALLPFQSFPHYFQIERLPVALTASVHSNLFSDNFSLRSSAQRVFVSEGSPAGTSYTLHLQPPLSDTFLCRALKLEKYRRTCVPFKCYGVLGGVYRRSLYIRDTQVLQKLRHNFPHGSTRKAMPQTIISYLLSPPEKY